MIKNANHYAPNNFVEESPNQTPVCSRPRAAPEDEFSTTQRIQNQVIKSIARVINSSYNVFVRSKKTLRLSELKTKAKLLVEEIEFL